VDPRAGGAVIRAIAIAGLLGLAAGTARAGHCHEESPIVGRRVCGGFGSGWAHRRWIDLLHYEATLVLDRVPVPAFDVTGQVYSAAGPADYHAALAAGTARTMWALGPRVRLGYSDDHFALGLEGTPTFALTAPTLNTTVDGAAPTRSSSGFVFDMVGVIGGHGRVANTTLGAEAAIGARNIALPAPLPPGYTACPGGATSRGCAFAVNEVALLVELRVRADVWLSPHTTLGGSVGVDVRGRGETFALTLAYHLSAFDGT
jgi:hypothetical protein